ncbi:MAG: PTS system mannose/fructose/sorbose family transporter subunit IID [Pedobacter sp.]
MNEQQKLSNRTLWVVALRALVLQASWSFGRMQNLGFLFAVLPALRRIYQGHELQSVCKRNLAYFNSNPVLAFPIIGASLRLEAKKSCGAELVMEVEEFKSALAGPCAAMGDSFFWATLRPLAAITAVWLAFAGYWWAVPVFLVLYNVPAIGLRFYGFMQGYQRDYKIVDNLQRWRLSDLAYRLRSLLVVVLGGFSAWVAFSGIQNLHQPTVWGWLAVPGVLIAGSFVRRGLSSFVMLIGLVLLLWIGLLLCSSLRF